mmetsp:Transcript_28880/g.46276  ORF Transcript_28880/g.46276 Transcript_28880/m.46276 type:complete len:253 (-) Transcript_28880:80-838(-)
MIVKGFAVTQVAVGWSDTPFSHRPASLAGETDRKSCAPAFSKSTKSSSGRSHRLKAPVQLLTNRYVKPRAPEAGGQSEASDRLHFRAPPINGVFASFCLLRMSHPLTPYEHRVFFFFCASSCGNLRLSIVTGCDFARTLPICSSRTNASHIDTACVGDAPARDFRGFETCAHGKEPRSDTRRHSDVISERIETHRNISIIITPLLSIICMFHKWVPPSLLHFNIGILCILNICRTIYRKVGLCLERSSPRTR